MTCYLDTLAVLYRVSILLLGKVMMAGSSTMQAGIGNMADAVIVAPETSYS